MSNTRDISLIIQDLAKVPGLKFVGGTSLFIQGKLEFINDIDVTVPNVEEIKKVFDVMVIDGTNGERAYSVHNGILIDVFIREDDEDTILVGENARCVTIESQIEHLVSKLKTSLKSNVRQETVAKIEYLKTLL
ncbi:hypothetical protein KBP46_09935 [Chryseobacterium sp. PCH239]|uniref:hypothetical protein n=1 Tax=Chryseobacterium sp. PCH239 TaxID=2825845 RepID=UPI001C0F9C08|nr:hypothetical protein [Chryseobacterium sp. PCH239]QWT88115.1 hypothetical protein KBP46_09935 [Chryseobacterium sp. PCH239]